MSETIPCLLRVGDNVKKYKVIKLDSEKVTIGRSAEVNYVILSNMISRCHAVLKCQEDKTWTITDNKSLNGVYVNGIKLQPFVTHSLKDGDMVQLGVPTAPDVPAEFVYKFHSSLKIRIEKKAKKFKGEHQDSTLPSDSSQISENGSELDEEQERKRKAATANQKEDSHVIEKQQSVREEEYKAKLAEMQRLLKEKEEKQSEVERQLEKERQQRERQAQEVAELKEKEQAFLNEMYNKQAQLEKEKDELKKKIQEELEITLKEKELVLKAQLAQDKESLMEEKRQVEENLQTEMAKALKEKNKDLEGQLIKMKDDLDKVIEEKEREQKMLESRLNETREESELAKLNALKAQEDVKSDFADLMEMELQCSICNELFIKAVSLNCSHVFCKLCINQWMKVKKECPNCRTAITSQMQAIALDSYIDKMVERLSDDLKARRKTMVEHRKAEQDKFDGVVPGTSGMGQTPRPARTTTAPVTSVTQGPPAATRVSHRIRERQQRGGAGRGRGRGRGRGNAHASSSLGQNSTYVTTANVTASTTTTIGSSTATIAATVASTTAISAATTGSTNEATSSITPSSRTEVESIEISSDDDDDNEIDDDDDELAMLEEEEEEEFWRRRRRRHHWTSESESDQEEEDEDSLDSMDLDSGPEVVGISGKYYGGYGRCFKCGNRGHWANGCPF